MSSNAVVHFLLGFLFQLLLQSSLVEGAIIPETARITTTNATLGDSVGHCVNYEGWVGNGIARADCAEAIREFYRTDVQPRGGQEYEFFAVRTKKMSNLPTVITPRKHDYGK